MPTFKDLTGMKFGRLTVKGIDHKEKSGNRYRYYWRCQCSCGNEHVARTDSLTGGNVQSCGCLHVETAVQNVSKHHSHKKSSSSIYKKWQGIKKRCFDTKDIRYSRYGGRGIGMYKDWIKNFQAFYEYVSSLDHCCEDGYTLDRINNDKGYEPGNLRWASAATQARNRSTNVIVEFNGEVMTLKEASEKSGISYSCLSGRYNRGDRGKRLFRPLQTYRTRPVMYKGKAISITQLSKKIGVASGTLQARYSRGVRGEKLYKACQHRGNHSDCE